MGNNDTEPMYGTFKGVPNEDPSDKKRKRLIVILISILVALVLGLLGYWFFSGSNNPSDVTLKDKEDSPTGETGKMDEEEVLDDTTSFEEVADETDGTDEEDDPTPPGPSEPVVTPDPGPEEVVDEYPGTRVVLPTSIPKIETGSSITISNNKDLPMEYDFGDGSTDSGTSVEHRYKKPGRYTLIGKSPDGREIDRKDLVVHCGQRTLEATLSNLKSLAENPKSDPNGTRFEAIQQELKDISASGTKMRILKGPSTTRNRKEFTTVEDFVVEAITLMSNNKDLKVKKMQTSNSNGLINSLDLYEQ
jgi:hypothetical protein